MAKSKRAPKVAAKGPAGRVGLLLEGPPDHDAFAALCAHLDTLSGDALGDAIEAADRGLASWPDELRVAPVGWWKKIRSGKEEPRWPLARLLSLGEEALAGAAVVADLEALSSLRRLWFGGWREADAAPFRQLLSSPHLVDLEGIELAYVHLGVDGAKALAAVKTLRKLLRLEITYGQIRDAGLEALLASSLLAKVEVLALRNNEIGPPSMKALGAAKTVGALRELDLESNKVGDAVGAALASKTLGKLTSLSLKSCGLTAAGVTALANASCLRQLERLELDGNKLGDAGIRALSSLSMPKLRWLGLGHNGLDGMALASLAGCANLAAVETLILDGNELADEGITALAGSPHWQGLRALSVVNCGVGTDGATALAESRLLGQLTSLNMLNCKVGKKGWAALMAAKRLDRLEHLGLVQVEIGDEGAALLAKAKLPSLRRLDLDNNKIGLVGLTALLESPLRLESLVLNRNKFVADGAAALAAAPSTSSLRSLQLGHVRIGSQGLESLAQSTHLGNLLELDVSNGKVTGQGLRALVAAVDRLPRLLRLELGGNTLAAEEMATLWGAPHLAQAALAGGLTQLEELRPASAAATASSDALTMDQGLTFLRELIVLENVGQQSKAAALKKAEKEVATRCALGASLRFNGGASPDDVAERILFQVKQYRHPSLGPLFRGYVSANLKHDDPAAATFADCWFAAPVDGELKLIARYSQCYDCHGRGVIRGRPCTFCREHRRKPWKGTWNGWQDMGGVTFRELGELVEVRKLQAPAAEDREEYDAE